MPDFQTSISGTGLSVPVWTDPASTNPPAPSRLNAQPLSPPRYRRVQLPGPGGSITITIAAIVGGVAAPFDTSLGGRLFTAAWVEFSGAAPPMLLPTPGQSALMLVTFDHSHAGHHLLSLRRLGGGSVGLPLDVEA